MPGAVELFYSAGGYQYRGLEAANCFCEGRASSAHGDFPTSSEALGVGTARD